MRLSMKKVTAPNLFNTATPFIFICNLQNPWKINYLHMLLQIRVDVDMCFRNARESIAMYSLVPLDLRYGDRLKNDLTMPKSCSHSSQCFLKETQNKRLLSLSLFVSIFSLVLFKNLLFAFINYEVHINYCLQACLYNEYCSFLQR